MKKDQVHQSIYIVIILFFFVLLFLRFSPKTAYILGDFFSPFQNVPESIGNTLANKSKSELIDEIKALEQELEKKDYHAELKDSQALVKELEEQMLLDLPSINGAQYRKVVAAVISRDPASGTRNFRINRGTMHGLKKGQAVLSSHYLVGRVDEVSKNTAVVRSLNDPISRVAAKVKELNLSYGVLFGMGEERWKSKAFCKLKHLPRDLKYEPGMLVVTSENSFDLPAGIPIGPLEQNADSDMVETIDQLYKNVWVKPEALNRPFSIVIILVKN